MDQSIVITVIVPIYNIVDCLPKCVDSIRKQTYRNLEIILVDDGSTDNSGALAEKFALEDRRIKVYHKENGGSSSARNLGIEKATGQYIGFVDSDDFIEPKMYERMLMAMLPDSDWIVQCSRDEINEQGEKMPDVCVPPEKMIYRESTEFLQELLMHRGDASFCTKLTKSSLLKEHPFPEGELNEDFRLITEILPEISGVIILPQQDYHVYYRLGSNTRKKDKKEFSRVFMDIVNNADRVEAIVEKRYPELKQEAERFALYQRMDYLLHIPIVQMNHSNAFYLQVVHYLKAHRRQIRENPFLTEKNRKYLLLFATAPRFVRQVHAFTMKVRGVK